LVFILIAFFIDARKRGLRNALKEGTGAVGGVGSRVMARITGAVFRLKVFARIRELRFSVEVAFTLVSFLATIFYPRAP
jgi:hypothetical protein